MQELNILSSQRTLLSAEQITAESIFVGTLRLANAFSADTDSLFKDHGLTSAQYNTLRVLRDAPRQGLSCQQISSALIQRDPDVTRLADRLEERGFVIKERAKNDRRVVLVRLTEKGLQLVNELDWPVVESHIESLSTLSAEERKTFLGLLQKLLKVHSPSEQVFIP